MLNKHHINVFANHGLDFKNSSYSKLENVIFDILHEMPVSDDFYLMCYDHIYQLKDYEEFNVSTFWNIKGWVPLLMLMNPETIDWESFEIKNKHLSFIGQMGMFLEFTPHHIKLPIFSSVVECFNSSEKKAKVNILRTFFLTVLKHFQGDHALYVPDEIAKKYYTPDMGLPAFENLLKEKYGNPIDSLYEYGINENPAYYIDRFEDLKK